MNISVMTHAFSSPLQLSKTVKATFPNKYFTVIQFSLKSINICKRYIKKQRGPDFMEHAVYCTYTAINSLRLSIDISNTFVVEVTI